MKLFYDTQMPSFIRDAPQGVYNKELDMQSECRLCHDKKVKDLPDDDDDSMGTGEGEDRTTNNDWQQYADGRAPELKDVTETDYVSEAKKYAGTPENYQYKNEYISPLPVAPPVPLPANPTAYAPTPVDLQPYTNKYTPPPANPVARQKVTNHLEDVLTPATSPFQKMKFPEPTMERKPDVIDNLRLNKRFVPDEEYTFPEMPLENNSTKLTHLEQYKRTLKNSQPSPQQTTYKVNYNNRIITSQLLKEKLEKLAKIIKKNIIITGGDRTTDRNKKVGGAKASRHLVGDAADIKVIGISNADLAKAAQDSGLFNTVIYYPQPSIKGALPAHVHVDLNPSHNNLFLKYIPTIINGKVKHKYVPY